MTKRPRILIDALAYDPEDGGFATLMEGLLASCAAIPDFEFVVAHHERHASRFRQYELACRPVWFPERMRFLVGQVITPLLARAVGAAAVHCEISAPPRGLHLPVSVTVADLYFLIDTHAFGSRLGRRLMQTYWQRLFVASLGVVSLIKAISESTANDISRLVPRHAPIRIIYPHVSVSASTDVPIPLNGPLRIVTIGSVIPRRNLPFLFRALRSVRRPWELDVVGAHWWGIDEVLAERDPRIRLRGYLSAERRDAILADSHLLVAPSLHEGFGYPVAEAMAKGKPVLTSDIGVFREYVPTSCRFSLATTQELTEMIEGIDEAWRVRTSRECLQSASRFRADRHVANHAAFFTELLRRGRATREAVSTIQ